jgi:hypothetical protein
VGGVTARKSQAADAATSANETVEVRSEAPSIRLKDEKTKELESKLHPALLSVYECWAKSKTAKCGTVQNGRLAVQVWLSDTSPSVMKQLESLGFVLSKGKAGAQVHGTMSLEKVQQLAAMKEVKLVALEQ